MRASRAWPTATPRTRQALGQRQLSRTRWSRPFEFSDNGTPFAFASQLVTLGAGFPTFAAQEAVDTSYFNGRVVEDFVIFSVPQLGTYTPGTDPVGFDPTKFVTYCTDSAILEKINVDAVQGVLKGICIK
jgi:hypothetical protein